MSQPSILLSFLIAGVFSSAFSIIFSEKKSHLFFYLITGTAGFFIGMTIGNLIDQRWLQVGEVNIAAGLVGSIAFLWFCRLGIQSAA